MAHQPDFSMPSHRTLAAIFSRQLVSQLETQFQSGTSGFSYTFPASKAKRTFYSLVLEEVQSLTSISLTGTNPSSSADFLKTLDKVLSSDAKKKIRSNLEAFDKMSGVVEGSIADTFLARLPFAAWLCCLCEVLMYSQPDGSTSSGSFDSRAPFHQLKPMSYDGPFDQPVPPEKKIVQVDLEGPSIAAAWRRNTQIVDDRVGRVTLHKLETRYALGSQASPANAGSYSVFHGTSAHFHEETRNWPQRWTAEALNLQGACEDTQANPPGVPVVYTAFSPMRGFLWGAFGANIFNDLPEASMARFMNQQWSSNGQAFRGVALFVFETQIPTPSGCNSFVLPRAKAEQFVQKVHQMSSGHDALRGHWQPGEAWKELRPIHGSTNDSWPHLLHTHECGSQLRQLERFPMPMNLWRTCWFDQGIETLNKCYQYTVAITFTHKLDPPKPPPQVAARAPQPPPDRDNDKDKDKDEGKRKNFFQKMGKKLSRISLRGSD